MNPNELKHKWNVKCEPWNEKNVYKMFFISHLTFHISQRLKYSSKFLSKTQSFLE